MKIGIDGSKYILQMWMYRINKGCPRGGTLDSLRARSRPWQEVPSKCNFHDRDMARVKVLKCVKCELNLKFRRKIAISNFIILNIFGMLLYIHEWSLLVKTRSFYVQVVGPPGGSSNFSPKNGLQFPP